MCAKASNIPRRHAIPILYTRGSHYDVGFDMGRTFASMIKSFIQLSGPLNNDYLPLYNTEKGKNAFNETLDCVKKNFPQYIQELEGIADGSNVEFHKLFLLHMDDILPRSVGIQNTSSNHPIGCSTIILNSRKARILAHTEDALTETLNHYYFVVAHIISDTPNGKYNTTEEHFMSLCYAGHLPGYTMNYNYHGLVFSINTLSAMNLSSGKTPRHFLSRALLATENLEQALTVLKDAGVGSGDGCSINLTFIYENNSFYNIEMAPAINDATESILDILEIPVGNVEFHANKYERIKIKEANPYMYDSSVSRVNTFKKYKGLTGADCCLNILGDQTGGEHTIFRENGNLDEPVKTICVGIFDVNAKTFSLYSDNPRTNKPHITLPFILKK